MRKAIILLMVMAIAGTAVAVEVDTSAKGPEKDIVIHSYDPPQVVLQGGDTIADATVIPSLPYSNTGNTCNFLDDYDEICPFSSTSPDVVYSFTPGSNISIDVDLCGSLYDTKIYIYDSNLHLRACNEDFYNGPPCGDYTSKIEGVGLTGGETYYIVIDGWSGDCGEYLLLVEEAPPPCFVICPADAMPEGEPPPVNEYIDEYNGGCNSEPPVYQWIDWANDDDGVPPWEGDTAWLCGVSGWYIVSGEGNRRDTDWFNATASGTEMVFTVESQYPCIIFQLFFYDCNDPIIVQTSYPECGLPASLIIPTNPGDIIHLFVAPVEFSTPDGTTEFPYIATLSGHDFSLPVPIEERSWGGVKALYR